jgi:hypothetical protein
MTVMRHGDSSARDLSRRIAAPVASIAALAVYGINDAANGQLALDVATGNLWKFSAACALAGDNIFVAGSGSGNGRWLHVPGLRTLVMPITFATADAAVLATVPTGAVLMPEEFYWTISTSWTGGSSSAIGVSSNKTGFSTKGDLLGGASGNVLADLTTVLSPTLGTIGAGFDTLAKRRALWVAGNTFRFDRIASVFTAGAGAVNAKVSLLANAGA